MGSQKYPGAWYHIMNRGRRGEKVFSDGKDYETFMVLLKEAAEIFNLRVSAYCLMSNHYHLLVQTPNGNLSRVMRQINGVYTQRFNRRHGEKDSCSEGAIKVFWSKKIVVFLNCCSISIEIQSAPKCAHRLMNIPGPAIMAINQKL